MAYETSVNFVKKWVEASHLGKNQSWIADELNMSRQQVSTMSVTYRKRGVKLPNLQAGASLDIEKLNKIIDELS